MNEGFKKNDCERDHDHLYCGGSCVSADSNENCGRCGNRCGSYGKCINRTCEQTGNAD